jgi:hypothetical protein
MTISKLEDQVLIQLLIKEITSQRKANQQIK